MQREPQDASAAYWLEVRHPLTCLIFLVPLLLLYESGVLLLGGGELRGGADYWLRCGLQQAGIGHPLLLPVLVVTVLLGWQVVGKYPWRVSGETLLGMAAESLLYAFLLILLGQLQDGLFRGLEGGKLLAMDHAATAARTISFLGAGVYEEVLFRLCLLPAGQVVFRLLALPHGWASGLAIVTSSLVFALAHHIGTPAEAVNPFNFVFRMVAGVVFAGLFLLRGFGIAVGTHSFYDLLVGVLLVGPG